MIIQSTTFIIALLSRRYKQVFVVVRLPIIRTQIRSIYADDDELKKKTAIVTDTVIPIYDLTSRAVGSS